MALWKMPKNIGKSSSQGSDIISNTLPRSINTVKTWKQVSNVLQRKLINCSNNSNDNEKEGISTKYKVVTQSEIHKIATRPHLLLYCDMIKWALDHADIPTRKIFNE
jgi:hypothetical protein